MSSLFFHELIYILDFVILKILEASFSYVFKLLERQKLQAIRMCLKTSPEISENPPKIEFNPTR